MFDSRASLDTFFPPSTVKPTESASVFIIGFEDSTIYLSICDSFEIGKFKIHEAYPALQCARLLQHCSHPALTTHPLIVRNGSSGEQGLFMLPLDLRLLSSAGRYLSLLASKLTQLHGILRYIRQAQQEINSEFKTAQDLPKKFIRNIDESLKARRDCTWVEAAYHLAVTGDCYPEVKEWLADDLGERVRWLSDC